MAWPTCTRKAHQSMRMLALSLALLLSYLLLGVWAVDIAKLRLCLDTFTNSTVLASVCQSDGDTTTTTLEQVVRDVFGTCLQEDLMRDLRIKVPNASLLPALQRHAATFQSKYNISVALSVLEVDELAAEVRRDAQQQLQVSSDGWIVDPSVIGDLVTANALVNLTSWVFEDPALDWAGFTRFFRMVSPYFDTRVVGVPLDGDLLLMYYRRDLFDRFHLTVPVVWDEFVNLAERMNGTDTDGDGVGDLWGVCLDNLPAVCKSSWLLTAVLAPYVQYLGTQQGIYIDPATMKPLVKNVAMTRAVELYRRLSMVGPRPNMCSSTNPFFNNGSCLMTINFGEQFKLNAQTDPSGGSSSVNGTMLGVSRLPGSFQVLNRTSGALMTCTGQSMCPYAKWMRLANGTWSWVNFAPFSAFGGWMGMVNARAIPEYQRLAFKFFSHVSEPANSYDDVLEPTSGLNPIRSSMLQLTPANLAKWTSKGYDGNATLSFLMKTGEALEDANVVMDIRLRGMSNATRVTMASVADNSTWLQQPIAQVLQMGQLRMEVAINGSGGNFRSLQAQYWQLIGYSPDKPNKTPVIPSSDNIDEGDGNSGRPKMTIALSVLVPSVAVLLGLAMGVLLWRRLAGHRNILHGSVKAPTAGLQTSILITDIQDSTSLWEALPDDVMDTALKTHHSVVRQALLKHNGYESATEGDSFILAFHSAEDAVACALRIQVDLLVASWPPLLLRCTKCPSAAEVWVTAARGSQQHAALVEMLGGSSCDLKSQKGRAFCIVRSLCGMRCTAVSNPLRRATSGRRLMPRPTRSSSQLQHGSFAAVTGKSGAMAAGAGGDMEASGLKHADSQQQMSGQGQLRRLSTFSAEGDRDTTVSSNWNEAFLSLGSSTLQNGDSRGSAGVFGLFSGFAGMILRSRRQPQQSQEQVPWSSPGTDISEPLSGKPWLNGVYGSAGISGTAGINSTAVAATAASATAGNGFCSPWTEYRLLHDHIQSVWQILETAPTTSMGCAVPHHNRCMLGINNTTAQPGVTTTAMAGMNMIGAVLPHSAIGQPSARSSGDAVSTSTSAMLPSSAAYIKQEASQGSGALVVAAAPTPPLTHGFVMVDLVETPGSACEVPPAVLQPQVPSLANSPQAGGARGMNPFVSRPAVSASLPSNSSRLSYMDMQSALQQHMPPSQSPSPLPQQPQRPPIIARISQHIMGPCDDDPGGGGATPGGGGTNVCRLQAPRQLLAYRGLRVRMGIHSGVPDSAHVLYNRAEARYHYAGIGMAIARAVQGAAAGGQVLLSDATFALVRNAGGKQLHDAVLIHTGEHMLDSKNPTSHQLYQALPRQLLCRLSLQSPLKVFRTVAAGALDAPVGRVAIAFVSIVGAATLQAWRPNIMRQSLGAFQEVFLAAAAAHATHGSYLVECTSGLLLAAFASAADALATCISIQSGLLMADWLPELLQHELCEEVAIATPQSQGTIVREVLFRGLRAKAGIDFGPARAALNGATGRIAYRGRVMNRAARINSQGASGQVLCSRAAWQAASDVAENGPAARGLAALSMGRVVLKGICEPVEILEVRQVAAAKKAGGSTRMDCNMLANQLSGSLNAIVNATAAAVRAPSITGQSLFALSMVPPWGPNNSLRKFRTLPTPLDDDRIILTTSKEGSRVTIPDMQPAATDDASVVTVELVAATTAATVGTATSTTSAVNETRECGWNTLHPTPTRSSTLGTAALSGVMYDGTDDALPLEGVEVATAAATTMTTASTSTWAGGGGHGNMDAAASPSLASLLASATRPLQRTGSSFQPLATGPLSQVHGTLTAESGWMFRVGSRQRSLTLQQSALNLEQLLSSTTPQALSTVQIYRVDAHTGIAALEGPLPSPAWATTGGATGDPLLSGASERVASATMETAATLHG